MNTMNFIVWMLPVIFILHDFEEIIMAEGWGKRYNERINKIWPKNPPFGLNYSKKCQTASIALGVNIELVLFSLISWFSAAFQSYYVWCGAMYFFIFHLVIHIILCIKFKGFVPGVITAIIFLAPSIFYAYAAEKILCIDAITLTVAFLIGLAFALFVMLPLLHKFTGPCAKWLYKYSMKTNKQ
ncbi:HXXEE domain-containing protein [Clostridium estertheticum]|uniref:HXXEE domain-containing protein n=1 Tax=Clostridium estertheticum TaxID=238834 RepID=UPI001CF0E163|nr:HXXEE domain-containing protein [Clostridium estertheticum]MCB2342857.1 HXXEE domain-containing protein [Clostridium estertheticum]